MKEYIIITDSTCDLPQDFVVENNIAVHPLTYNICGKEYHNYLDAREQSSKEFYDLLRQKHTATTAQLNIIDIEDVWTTYLDKGYDILVLGFSSALSGSFNAMRIAKEELEHRYPNQKIKLIDTLSASGGEGLYVFYANELKKQGLSIDENYTKLKALRKHLVTWFTVDDIGTLYRGGRLSGGAAVMAKCLRIKPVLKVDNEGRLQAIYKKIGRRQALVQLVESTLKTLDTSFKQTLVIGHADSLEDAKILEGLLNQALADVKIEADIMFINIGPVIGAHAGPGTLLIASVGSSR